MIKNMANLMQNLLRSASRHYNAAFFSFLFFSLSCFLASCSSDTTEYDPYHDWEERNAAWYEQIADSARTAITSAQQTYGDAWEEHCDWRMMKSLLKSPTYDSGQFTDSICIHIISRGTGEITPCFTDTVRLHFRGWLMPTLKADGTTEERVFTQTYYSDFNSETAAPQTAPVSAFKDGFATALQYMVAGDDWLVYIPQQLFYGSTVSTAVPAYSTARFRINLVAVYPIGTKVPEWK